MDDFSNTLKAKSDQVNADDLRGCDMRIKITKVKITNDAQQPMHIFYEGGEKRPYKPSLGMRRAMAEIWKTTKPSKLVGRELVLFREPTVIYAGKEVGGIQISHASHLDKPIIVDLTITRGKKTKITIKPMSQYKPEVSEVQAPKGMSDEQFASLCADGNVAADDGMDAYKEWFMDVKSSPFSDAQRQEFEAKHNEWKVTANANTSKA